MEYETSYDIGVKPYRHDNNRGKWESSKDFFFACAGHALRLDIIMAISVAVFESVGIYTIIPYLIILAVCVVPIVFIQSFLGQFSGTGYISVFRIAPLFKGIGYVSLAVNIVNLTYFSVFGAIPLFYFFHSLRPTIPWSCEGCSEWMDANKTICYEQTFNSPKVPSVEFFRYQFHFTRGESTETHFSVQFMICTVIVWSVAIFVLLKPTEHIGRFMRYTFLAVISIMSLCLVRFIFLPGAINGISEFLAPRGKGHSLTSSPLLIPLMVFSTLGPGWGSILTMASYNDFKTDIYKYSWFTCLAQFGVMIGMVFLSIFLKHFMQTLGTTLKSDQDWIEILILPSALTFLEWPNFWTILFFGMILLSSLNLLVIQLFSLFTALFDEFESLREIKRSVIYGTVAVLALTSLLFCTNHGVSSYEMLAKCSTMTQVILNLLLLLVVLWVYGRERFQRDLTFMTDNTYSTCMVYIVRFVAPFVLLCGLTFGCILFVISLIFGRDYTSTGILFIGMAVLFFLLLWCLVPCYCITKIKNTAGNIGVRLRRCVRPTDWYPADPAYKQSYEERFSSTDISHPLTF